ncbi:hypothetical protein ABL78_4320 [Leptomonas seymouri]|uniref:Uncharacterized protein n=1 Tax=Leptomonas seymouri TaxID=5684 RepID=A0A0N1PD52_LEPSE|nr:hypothetical protein ABL78_4320 [Leptomonas seymouri]|eukprot:KPI86591.1 hypothetical protein ABL78_4320 [Leptomonas seymouri]
MPLQAWVHRFFAFEARNGGALPSHQLFPFTADSEASAAEFSDAPDRPGAADRDCGGLPANSPTAALSAEAEEGNSERTSPAPSSSSSSSAPPPPPPPCPPPTAAITAARKRSVKVRDAGCNVCTPGELHEPPRFYSRYVFLRTVAGLQLLWGYFSVALWNYLAHIQWYGATIVDLGAVRYTGTSRVMVEAGAKGTDGAAGPATVSSDDVQHILSLEPHRLPHQWLAVAYLAFALAGLTYTVSAVLYVCVVNTPCHVRAAWPQSQLLLPVCCPDAGSDPFQTYAPVQQRPPSPPSPPPGEEDLSGGGRGGAINSASQTQSSSSPPPLHPSAAYAATGLHQRHAPPPLPSPSAATSGVVPLSFTQPQFLFPLHRLTVLDGAAAASVRGDDDAALQRRSSAGTPPPWPPGKPSLSDQQQQPLRQNRQGHPGPAGYAETTHYVSPRRCSRTPLPPPPQQQQQQHRGDPKAPLLWCAFPLVVALVVSDFVVIHCCRVQGWPVRLLQGLTPVLGLLLLFYTMKSVVVLCARCCMLCWSTAPTVMYTLTKPPPQRGYDSPEQWTHP